MEPVVVLGLPRSGTTWVAEILSSPSVVQYLHEPDSEGSSATALHLKREVHRFPDLGSDDDAPDFSRLWSFNLHAPLARQRAFAWLDTELIPSGEFVETHIRAKCGFETSRIDLPLHLGVFWQLARRAKNFGPEPTHRLVKSVHSSLALPWLTENFQARFLLVTRHPFSLIASMRRLKLADRDRGLPDPDHGWAPDEAAIRQVAWMKRRIEADLRQRPSVNVVRHEDLCMDPIGGFQAVFDALDLPWTGAVTERLEALNAPGDGFEPKRKTRRQVNKHERELSREELETLEAVFEATSTEEPWSIPPDLRLEPKSA